MLLHLRDLGCFYTLEALTSLLSLPRVEGFSAVSGVNSGRGVNGLSAWEAPHWLTDAREQAGHTHVGQELPISETPVTATGLGPVFVLSEEREEERSQNRAHSCSQTPL